MTLAHWDDVEPEVRDVGEMRATFRALGEAAGATAVGVSRIEVEPGCRAGPGAPARLRGGDLLRARGLGPRVDRRRRPRDRPRRHARLPRGRPAAHRDRGRRRARPCSPSARTTTRRSCACRGRAWSAAAASGSRPPTTTRSSARPPPARSSCPSPRRARRAASRCEDVEVETDEVGDVRHRPSATSPAPPGSVRTRPAPRRRPAGQAELPAALARRRARALRRPRGRRARCVLYDNRGDARRGARAARRATASSRPAGTRLAHMLRAGEQGLTYLAYGTRDTERDRLLPALEEGVAGPRARARRAGRRLLGGRGLSAALLGRQLVVVTGKGGVGKSTVAAALGLVAAGRGLRTIVAEVARRDDVSRALGGEGMHEEELAPGLHHLSIDPEHAMEQYLADQLPRGAGRAARARAAPSATSPPRRRACASC